MTLTTFVTAIGRALMQRARHACIERCELIGGACLPVTPERAS